MSDEVYRCKTCRCPVCQTDDKASWVHELNGMLISHDCGYKDCIHKELYGKRCEMPEPDFECPLKYDLDARHYWIMPRVNIALLTAMQMFDEPISTTKQVAIVTTDFVHYTAKVFDCPVGVNPSWYYLNRVDLISVLDKIYPIETFKTLRS
jgi:hypothetical protein